MINYSELPAEIQELIMYVKLRHKHEETDQELRHQHGLYVYYPSISLDRLHNLLDELEKTGVKKRKK